ncbi:MAG: Transcriptional regulators Bxe_A1971/Bxe_A4420, LysR family [uncultured Caballeronia sp.]|nr:MAG: Transcriptional regulators Bxe_A1971/Bxe_A4420, LysR family [uncultured Caballeronia sp.]
MDLGSFARAAGAMDISNAVATCHIADLEGRLGTRLLRVAVANRVRPGQVYGTCSPDPRRARGRRTNGDCT